MPQPSPRLFKEFKGLEEAKAPCCDVVTYYYFLSNLYKSAATCMIDRDRWNVTKISTFKTTNTVKHVFLVLEVECEGEKVYLRIDRRKIFAKSDDSDPPPDNATYPDDTTRPTSLLSATASDEITFSKVFRYLVDRRDERTDFIQFSVGRGLSLPQIAVLAHCMNSLGPIYHFFGENSAYWFDVVVETAKLIKPDFILERTLKRNRGGWQSFLPTKKPTPEVIEKARFEYEKLWGEFNEDIYKTVNNEHSVIYMKLQAELLAAEKEILEERCKRKEVERLAAEKEGERRKREAERLEKDGTPIQMEMPFVTPEHPSIDRQSGNVHSSREVVDGEDPDLPIPKEASPIGTERHSVDRGGGVVQEGEATSMSFFQGSLDVKILNFNKDHDGNATIIRFGDGQFTDVQRNLICDYVANLTLLSDIKENLKKHVLTQSIISLPHAKAVFGDYQNKKKSGPCFKGTREALLRGMADWATGLGESRMYVLSRLAGIGKSTVAYTIASRAADLNLLGASFFFSREEADRNNAKRFFTTIAYQLCVYNEAFAKAIGGVLKTERGAAATTKYPQEQLQALILEPLRSIVQSRVRPILVVVDALNECDEDDERAVVKGLSRLIQELPSFKVILTTRPQPSLDPFFGSQGGRKIFHLQDIEDKVVDGDIRLYLKHYLSLLQVQKHHPKRQWCASDEEIESLVRASRKLFIIASRTVWYILDESASNPAAQMQRLLHAFAQGRMPFKDLDEIQQDFEMNFGRVFFGWGIIVGILMAILAHQR